ncbi:hypothetical protein SAMN05444169_3539 [Bradyrhizobium erythrophlei]|uniref:Uncharacterized protein n=2 Tax=Bradyrhizobium erythrophlei TaxID=1437360 RepID=A0A1M5LLQ4_9BRAD|nr:hypothetical protein SAMN05444169_3539 [Bradyrhizobium erythrophlei]
MKVRAIGMAETGAIAVLADGGHPTAREISRAEGFRVEFVRDWKQAFARWNDIDSSTPFQDRRWLDAWYAAFANLSQVQPLIAVVHDAATSEQVALLPLVRRMQNGVRIVEFADLNLTDYNAPLLAASAPRKCSAGARIMARSSERAEAPAGRRRSHSAAQDAARSRERA